MTPKKPNFNAMIIWAAINILFWFLGLIPLILALRAKKEKDIYKAQGKLTVVAITNVFISLIGGPITILWFSSGYLRLF